LVEQESRRASRKQVRAVAAHHGQPPGNGQRCGALVLYASAQPGTRVSLRPRACGDQSIRKKKRQRDSYAMQSDSRKRSCASRPITWDDPPVSDRVPGETGFVAARWKRCELFPGRPSPARLGGINPHFKQAVIFDRLTNLGGIFAQRATFRCPRSRREVGR